MTITIIDPLTYEKGNGYSYFIDLARSVDESITDEAVEKRLVSHRVEARRHEGFSDLGGGWSSDATPPLYLLRQFPKLLGGWARVLDVQPVPPCTNSVDVPTLPLWVGETVEASVVPVTGQQGLGRDVVRGAVNLDEIIFRDLAELLSKELGRQLTTGSGKSGYVVGLGETPGIHRVTVEGSMSLDLVINAAAENCGEGAAVFMHSDLADSLGRPPHRRVPVVVDDLVTPSAEVVYVLNPDHLSLYISPPRTRVLPIAKDGKALQKASDPVEVFMTQMFAFVAFAAQNPSGIVEITVSASSE